MAQNDAVIREELTTESLTTNDDAAAAATAPNGVVLLGKYELLELLGVGSSAKVYHARRVDTGESVAVKAVRRGKNGYAAYVEREVSIMRRLRHPHTVRLFEVLATKTKAYFVMEYAAGGELLHRVDAAGKLSEDLARKYFRQLMSAVAYCHSRGVYHRDLKLDNLLVDENADLKVTDFGLSAGRAEIRPDGMLHTVCGTPTYVAPEILGRKGYDGASVDVWSCGVVLFALVAGYLPFNDYNITVLYRKIYRGQFRCPKWVSRDFKSLVTRMLDVNPKTRITVDEITRDPWFCRGGYKETRIRPEWEEDRVMMKDLNAFDLISFSSGFDMSGLFTDPEDSDLVERFVLGEAPGMVVEKVAEAAEKGKLLTVRKEGKGGCGGVRLEGHDGNFVIEVGVYRLTEKLVVVEVKRKQSGAEFWKDVLRPLLRANDSQTKCTQKIENN